MLACELNHKKQQRDCTKKRGGHTGELCPKMLRSKAACRTASPDMKSGLSFGLSGRSTGLLARLLTSRLWHK